jgi:transposase
MAQPYSDDLRCKFLEAYEAGAGSLQVLARQFRVSLSYGKKIRGQQKRTGQKERPAQWQHGPVSRVTEAAKDRLRSWLQEQPDLTEAELRERLQASGVSVCKSRVGQVLRAMGLRRKKNLSMPKNATLRRTTNGVKRSPNKSVRSRRNA